MARRLNAKHLNQAVVPKAEVHALTVLSISRRCYSSRYPPVMPGFAEFPKTKQTFPTMRTGIRKTVPALLFRAARSENGVVEAT
jgi:hypothetical protein